jgi:hypothetical protein
MLERRLRERRRSRGSRWRAHAHALADTVSTEQRAAWTASLEPRDWAGESLLLSRDHTFSVRDGAALGDRYYERSIPVVEQRLQQSGLRLAALLNATFDPVVRVE